MSNPPIVSAEYLAGFIDGDGCIAIHKSIKGCYCVYVQIVQHDRNKEILDSIKGSWGGKFSPMRSKNAWMLQWWGQNSRPILEAITPYLLGSKHYQAILALEFIALMPGKGSAAPHTEMENLSRRIKELKNGSHAPKVI